MISKQIIEYILKATRNSRYVISQPQRIFTPAPLVGGKITNPCQRVKKFKLDNEWYRFLTPTEEADLMSWLVKPREHLEPLVIVAFGLGLRKQEQLKLGRDQVDFSGMSLLQVGPRGRGIGKFQWMSWTNA